MGTYGSKAQLQTVTQDKMECHEHIWYIWGIKTAKGYKSVGSMKRMCSMTGGYVRGSVGTTQQICA